MLRLGRPRTHPESKRSGPSRCGKNRKMQLLSGLGGKLLRAGDPTLGR
jgi:hypothetical protein